MSFSRQSAGLVGSLFVSAWTYLPFWSGLIGGALAWAGVVLPHMVTGTRSTGTVLIIVGMAVLIGTSVWSLIDQRRRALDTPVDG